MPNQNMAGSDIKEPRFPLPDTKLALIVGSSRVNQIVVAKIAERAGLKVLSESPDKVRLVLPAKEPGFVIIDAGQDEKEWEHLLTPLAERRRERAQKLPYVIILCTSPHCPRAADNDTIFDAVVVKPITPERLQPVIESLLVRISD